MTASRNQPPDPRIPSRREFLRDGALVVAAAGLGGLALGCDGAAPTPPDAGTLPDAGGDGGGPPLDGSPAPEGGGDAPAVDSQAADAAAPPQRPATTVRERVEGVLPPTAQPGGTKAQWGLTHVVPGAPHVRTDLLGVSALAGTPTGPEASFFYAAQLTDVHIVDEESPARSINLDHLVSPAWRWQEAHCALVLDAMIRKVRALDAFRRIDCVLFTGDMIDNNQGNELGWFLRAVAGKTVQPNSGLLEDPTSGPGNDPHDAFAAAGLGSIPWYAAVGNHDVLVQGNLAHAPLVGYSLIVGDPTRGTVKDIDLGRVNPPACNPLPPASSPVPPRCIPTAPELLSSGSLPSDSARAHLSRSGLIQRLKAAPGAPAGHGLSQQSVDGRVGDYVVDPAPGVPLRVVVLDTTAPVGALGAYDRVESFLVPALSQAEADGVAVIVVSHHYSSAIPLHASALRSALSASPNVLLHLVGHGHHNQVTARPGADPLHGYWEVQTSSLADWPQQGRLLELVDKRDGTAELWLTLFDYDAAGSPHGDLLEAARFMCLWDVHSGGNSHGASAQGKTEDRNVILPVGLPQSVRQQLGALPGQPVESKQFG